MKLLGLARKALLGCLSVYVLTILFAVGAPDDIGYEYGQSGFAINLIAMVGVAVSAVAVASIQLYLFLTRSPKNG
jgi:hypothetical protein